jgi:hypothetical protein
VAACEEGGCGCCAPLPAMWVSTTM